MACVRLVNVELHLQDELSVWLSTSTQNVFHVVEISRLDLYITRAIFVALWQTK